MWLGRKTFEARLSAELRYHFESLVRDFEAAGVPPQEARRRARLEFGGVEQIKEECRDVRGRWLEDLWKDLRYTSRTLGRSPGFLAVSVLSLALGIGANTAVVSLINAVLLRSLPVQEPERLVQTWRTLWDEEARAEGFQRLTYELEARGDNLTQLTLTHDVTGAPRSAALLAGDLPQFGGGWPQILSDLKTLLETGTTLES